jgi:hypothetical protein
MSLDVKGQKCVVCKAYLFSEDDIVYCPECGAPHHRECYNSIGHCGLQEFHGTDKEYDRNKVETQQSQQPPVNNNYNADTAYNPYANNTNTPKYSNNQNNGHQEGNTNYGPYSNYFVTCGVCGAKYNPEEHACPNCNTPNIAKSGHRFENFDFSGGVPDDTDLGGGVITQEAKQYVRVNTQRYMPKFLKFKEGGRASWNIFAFLVPSAWLMSRKMYVLGGIVAAVEIALFMLMFPFINALNAYDISQLEYQQLFELIMENRVSIGNIAIITAMISSYAMVGIRVIFGIFGDLMYRKKAISKISEIKQSDTDVSEALQKAGGVNLIASIITCIVVFRLPQIIAYILGIL